MNNTHKYEFSIIVPIYNEEENMARLAQTLSEYIRSASVTSCVLFVNDGSKDNSLEKIREACDLYEDFYYIGFEKNCGLSAAIKAGIDIAESPYIGYIDADLQTSPDDFELLLARREAFALVTGYRLKRKDTLGKRLSSKIANSFRRMMTKDNMIDTGCPLKVIRTDYAKRVPFFTGMHRFLPALIMLQNGKVEQIPVRHFDRIAGKSKFHLWNRLLGPFKDCFAYRWMKKRYINYAIQSSNIQPQNNTAE